MTICLSDLVSQFYDACMDSALWPGALAKLAACFGADSCAVAVHDLATHDGRLEHTLNVPSQFVASYAEHYARSNVWVADDKHLRAAGVVRTGEMIVPPEQLQASAFFQEWLKPQNLFHHLFAVIDRDDNQLVLLVFARSAEGGPFGEAEVENLRRLCPALRRGLKAGRLFSQQQGLRQVAFEALDALPMGVAVLNAIGEVMAANRQARSMIEESPLLSRDRNGLSLICQGRTVRVRDLLPLHPAPGNGRNGAGRGDSCSFTLSRGPDHKPITVLIAPVRGGGDVDRPDLPAALAFIGDPDRAVEIDQARLIQLYGLSRAEARVAALIASGQRLDTAAETLGVAYETVRKHLKQIFGKTGTERQADLVRVLITGPAAVRL